MEAAGYFQFTEDRPRVITTKNREWIVEKMKVVRTKLGLQGAGGGGAGINL